MEENERNKLQDFFETNVSSATIRNDAIMSSLPNLYKLISGEARDQSKDKKSGSNSEICEKTPR